MEKDAEKILQSVELDAVNLKLKELKDPNSKKNSVNDFQLQLTRKIIEKQRK
ncbi:MAG: hypothetical protein GF364_20270 [Candidatus Lokiarchaeota archaeon]|nr:hypothetical protein [Candidatus Lokiarchaeota archaeon]